MVGLCRIALRDGAYARVIDLSSEALQLVEGLPHAARAMPLHLLAAGTGLSGDYARAQQLYMASLELNRELDDRRMERNELHNLGHVYLHLGRLDLAEEAFASRLLMTPSTEPYDVAMTALNEAALSFARGQADAARSNLDLATSTITEAGIVLDPDDAYEVAWLRERLAAG